MGLRRLGSVVAMGAVCATLLLVSRVGQAQVTLPWTEDFEGASGEAYHTCVAHGAVAGVPDASYSAGAACTAYDNTFSAGQWGANGTYDVGLVFDVTVATRLNVVHVYPASAGNVTVRLLDSNSTVLDTHTQAVTSNDVGQKTAISGLSFTLPVGNGYRLDAEGSTVSALYMNTGVNVYPMVGTHVVLTGNSISNNSIYPLLYEWITDHTGRLRTDAFPAAGSGAATLDKWANTANETATNYLTFTLDMSNYDVAQHVVFLGFMLLDHADDLHLEDRIWVSGSDQSPWVEMGNLLTLAGGSPNYVSVTGLDVTAALVGASQDFSSTFRIRFGQTDDDPTPTDGFSIDDISLHLQICGDGVQEGDEACDDGNVLHCDGCRGDCSAVETCGDTFLCGDEECDDGNTTDCDGCSAACVTEFGCGDGATCGAEACDDGNATDCDGCSADCGQVETGCGDGVLCDAEECDDGNDVDGDGCSATCDSEGTGGAGGTSSGAGGGEASDDGGCGCRVVGRSGLGAVAAVGLLGLLGLALGRRRRQLTGLMR